MLKLDDNAYLDATDFARHEGVLSGWVASVTIYSGPNPDTSRRVVAYDISLLDDGKLWGIDAEWAPWPDDKTGHCSMPIHCNGFGSIGCARRVFNDVVQDWINGALEDHRNRERWASTYKERAMMNNPQLKLFEGDK